MSPLRELAIWGGIALVVFLALYFLARWKYKGKPVTQAAILIFCIAVAMFIDERLIGFARLPGFCAAIYGVSYSLKWEGLALFAAAGISWLYWKAELRDKDKFTANSLFTAATSILVAVIFILFAIGLLVGSLWATSESWELGLFFAHVVCVWIVSICFLKADRATWIGVKSEHDKNHDLRNVSMLTYFLADWPAFAGLSLMGLFCLVHFVEHTFFPHWWRHSMYRISARPDQIDMWISQEYFMGGAIAFQYLASTTVYLIVAWGAIKIQGIAPVPITVELRPDEDPQGPNTLMKAV
jgi:hypothetical protein